MIIFLNLFFKIQMLWLILEFVFKIQWQLEIKELVSHKQAPSHE